MFLKCKGFRIIGILANENFIIIYRKETDLFFNISRHFSYDIICIICHNIV